MKKIGTAARGSSTKQAQTSAGKVISKKPVDQVLFTAAVASKLREINQLGEDEDFRNNPVVLQAIELFEIENGKAVVDYDNAVQASSAFNDWIDSKGFEYQAPVLYRIEDYTITLTVPTKSGEVSVSMKVTPLIDDHTFALQEAKKELQKRFQQAFGTDVERRELPGKENGKAKEYDVEDVNVSALRVSTYNNKVVYHAMPSEGKWVQFGIPLYKDVAKAEGIELPNEEGEYDVSWDVQYELKDDGKPRRVISIKDV